MIRLWTIGREREKQLYAQIRDAKQRSLLLAIVDAIHDIKEGTGTSDQLIEAARAAMIEGTPSTWFGTSYWLAKVVSQLPEVGQVWAEFASSPNWQKRWRVACNLYWDIPDELSNPIFAALRNDRSRKVREMAISRYENRPDATRTIVKMFDAKDFDHRVRTGEIAA